MARIRAENSHLGSILCDGTNSKVPQALEASEVSKYLSRVSHLGEGWEGGGGNCVLFPMLRDSWV